MVTAGEGEWPRSLFWSPRSALGEAAGVPRVLLVVSLGFSYVFVRTLQNALLTKSEAESSISLSKGHFQELKSSIS